MPSAKFITSQTWPLDLMFTFEPGRVIPGHLLPCDSMFHLEQRLLALRAPPISTHAAVLPDDSMARDHHRDRIRRASSRDRAGSVGPSNALCYLAIRPRRPEWNFLQICPHAPLKGRRTNVERQRPVQILPAHVPEQRTHPGL